MSDSQALLRSKYLATGRQSWAVNTFLLVFGVLIPDLVKVAIAACLVSILPKATSLRRN